MGCCCGSSRAAEPTQQATAPRAPVVDGTALDGDEKAPLQHDPIGASQNESNHGGKESADESVGGSTSSTSRPLDPSTNNTGAFDAACQYLPFQIRDVPVLLREADGYLVDNSLLKSQLVGLTVRNSKNLEDKAESVIDFGSTIDGIVEQSEDGVQWLKLRTEVPQSTAESVAMEEIDLTDFRSGGVPMSNFSDISEQAPNGLVSALPRVGGPPGSSPPGSTDLQANHGKVRMPDLIALKFLNHLMKKPQMFEQDLSVFQSQGGDMDIPHLSEKNDALPRHVVDILSERGDFQNAPINQQSSGVVNGDSAIRFAEAVDVEEIPQDVIPESAHSDSAERRGGQKTQMGRACSEGGQKTQMDLQRHSIRRKTLDGGGLVALIPVDGIPDSMVSSDDGGLLDSAPVSTEALPQAPASILHSKGSFCQPASQISTESTERKQSLQSQQKIDVPAQLKLDLSKYQRVQAAVEPPASYVPTSNMLFDDDDYKKDESPIPWLTRVPESIMDME